MQHMECQPLEGASPLHTAAIVVKLHWAVIPQSDLELKPWSSLAKAEKQLHKKD